MRIIETKVYQFDELDEKAKEKARDWFRQGIEMEFWADNVLEDAKRIGLEIKAFDLDRGSYVEGTFTASAEETAYKIEKEHGDTCETYKDAISYLEERDQVIRDAERDENGEFKDTYALDQALDELDAEFLKTLCEDYRIMLTQEMEYQYSDECVDENIRANEYEFTDDGERA